MVQLNCDPLIIAPPTIHIQSRDYLDTQTISCQSTCNKVNFMFNIKMYDLTRPIVIIIIANICRAVSSFSTHLLFFFNVFRII